MIMNENKKQPNINADGSDSSTSQTGENMSYNRKNPSAQQGQQENDENKDLDYSNLDIEESTGGSAMEQEGEDIRDIDKDEI